MPEIFEHTDQPKGPGRVERYTVAQIAEVLQKSRGMIAVSARLLNCQRNTVYGYIKRHKRLQRLIEDERELFVDKAELKLQEAVQQGEGWAVCFALKCLGKPRGYVERVEYTGADGRPVEFTFQIQRPTDGALIDITPRLALVGAGNGEPDGDGAAADPV